MPHSTTNYRQKPENRQNLKESQQGYDAAGYSTRQAMLCDNGRMIYINRKEYEFIQALIAIGYRQIGGR